MERRAWGAGTEGLERDRKTGLCDFTVIRGIRCRSRETL